MNSLARVLLLEDNYDDALLIQELLLQYYGSNTVIDHVTTANQATQLVQHERYNLFLIDYMLEEPPNGAEWITLIAQSIPLPPVIMLTGLPDVQRIEAIASKLSKVSYFISKDHLRSGALTQAINFTLVNQPSVNSTKGTILLADDDADDVMLIDDALQEVDQSFRLDVVNNGVAVMDYLHRRGQYSALEGEPLPELILLDLNMPRMDGRQVLVAINKNTQLQHIPIIILSTSSAQQDVHDCYDLGANSFISKSASFEGLVTMMRNLTTYWFDLVTLPKKP